MTGDQPASRLDELLDGAYHGNERLSRDEIHRYATAAELPADVMTRVDALPEGEYSQDEAVEALRQVSELTPEAGEDIR
jgi:hypothetical protein